MRNKRKQYPPSPKAAVLAVSASSMAPAPQLWLSVLLPLLWLGGVAIAALPHALP
ncbi:hypothetical protein C8J30_101533 [Rhodobacter viridis]|uniref:Uncharacterized protein n=1 Tax=Rhodobacter viridis TaxID=1054202 RepID=A0A318U3H6_9RHOB|nr:hypothetical protein C8J30_101533 [Rhodobacter viridis]